MPIENIKHVFARKMMELFSVNNPRRLAISLSGGVDSIALTSLVSEWAQLRDVSLHAYIIDHKLRSESSREAEEVCEYVESTFGVRSSIHKLSPPLNTICNVEEWARHARRNALSKACLNDNVQHLMLAHHWDDQAEVFLQRFLAGSHWMGLAGMKARAPLSTILSPNEPSINLLRPLLDIRKQSLIQLCHERNLRWWEDPTNRDSSYTQRNLVRKYFQVGRDLPPFLQHDELKANLQFFADHRDKVNEAAGRLFKQLEISGKLKIKPYEAQAVLEVGRELQSTPPAVLTELLYRIAAPLSPVDHSTVGLCRYRFEKLANMLKASDQFTYNVLGVEFSSGAKQRGKFKVCRERPRRRELLDVKVYKVGSEWSAWEPLDNRWVMRWKQPSASTPPLSPYFDVRFVKSPERILNALKPELDPSALHALQKLIKVHPLFMWSDPQTPHTIESKKIIGFPTLGIVRGLDIEVLPNKCVFT